MEPVVDHIQITVKVELRNIGATIVTEPKLYPEYTPDYYALFFKDPEGIKFEIVCNERNAG
jgi:hypothetical protein